MSADMKIGALAEAASCTVETVRYYERAGLLQVPARSSGNYRLYGAAHVDRLRFIRNCRALDMTHDEIRALLTCREDPEQQCDEVNALLDDHIGHVARRIRELRALERELKELRSQCQTVRPVRDCAIMHSLGSHAGRAATSSEEHGQMDRTHR
jgi:Cd(II)/Pb(II)-responsive transcriptional regulator